MKIRDSSKLFFVSNQSNFLRAYIVLSQIPFDVESCVIRRVIINDNYVKIAIILVENAVNIPIVSEVFYIVIRRDYNAEWKFFFVFA